MRIFKYLKTSALTVAVILAVLIAQSQCDMALPALTRDIVDVGLLTSTDYMIRTGVKMLAFTLASAACAALATFLASWAAAKVGGDLRRRTFSKILSFSGAEMDKFTAASLITRATNDIQQIAQAEVMALRMFLYAPIMGIVGVVKVSQTRSGLGNVVLGAVIAIFLVVIIMFRMALPKFEKLQTLVDKLNLVSREIISGIWVVRIFNREKFEEKRFDAANGELYETQLFTSRVMGLMQPLMMFIMNIVSVFIVWYGAKSVNAGLIQVGDLIATSTYITWIIMAFMMLSIAAVMIPRANVAAVRVDEVLETEPEIKDAAKSDFSITKGEVKFNNVSFKFGAAEQYALKNVSFTARPGETAAIVGSSGSGKSTLANLIPRIYDVTEGEITIDGTDIRKIPLKTLRKAIGFTPQKGYLFSGTIESNLSFGGNNYEKAAEMAQALDFINESPENFKSPIAQGGSNFSGGQKQRLAIARALSKDSKILIFDDSFSALDFKTDLKLRRALAENMKDRAIIIVAQRVATIMNADKIIVLEHGEVAGIGTHKELMETCAIYQEIAKSQLNERELGMEA
jgi:ATP-binding cassette subfamily B protein